MNSWMRLVLATAAFLTGIADASGMGSTAQITWTVFFGYVLHSTLLYILASRNHSFAPSRLVCWLDLLWYALMIVCTGGHGSYFFGFFFFAILTASFRWGFEEGTKITLAAAGLYALTAVAAPADAAVSQLLLKISFLLALGYMVSYWGGSQVTQKKRLALLRDVSQLSNPRFGVDHTIASVMEKTFVYFQASSCLLLMRDDAAATWSLRTVMRRDRVVSPGREEISSMAARPFAALPTEQVLLYARPLMPFLHVFGANGGCYQCVATGTNARWSNVEGSAARQIANLLETRSFVSAPLPLHKGEGRIFITSTSDDFHKSDALFLSDIAAQAFPVIENIELLDRLASGAATRERERISRDLHDSTIQPYIGLRHGLTALRNTAAADNPLIPELDKLAAMAATVIDDLRRYAGNLKSPHLQNEPMFIKSLRSQVAQVLEFYGVDIAVDIDGPCEMNDRLAAEVLQIVTEGISNIRKHTDARSGSVRLHFLNGHLHIWIENECRNNPAPAKAFLPRSISERATALGGSIHVTAGPSGNTAVYVDIPV